MPKVTKVDDVKVLVKKGVTNPKSVFSTIKKMAKDADWKVREVAATALVNISKKHPDAILSEMKNWSSDSNENIRRTSIECLRGIARKAPKSVLPHLEKLKSDKSIYVKKSVANIMRDASKGDPELIIDLCNKWIKSTDENTRWIIKNGIKKLMIDQQEQILNLLFRAVD